MSKQQRHRLYVDRCVQRALLWQLFRHWALFLTALLGMLFILQTLEAGPERSIDAVLGAVWTNHAPLLVVIAALFPAFAYDSIKLSNRFVGPILRLRRVMRQAADGEPVQPLQFRPNDYWQDLASSFNGIVERLPAPVAETPPAAPAQTPAAVGPASDAARDRTRPGVPTSAA